MELQTLLAFLIVLLAVGYVGRKLWRTMRSARVQGGGSSGCGDGGCGCG